MTWVNGPVLFYHGTIGPYADQIKTGVDLTRSKLIVDFGKGFYTTTILQQAKSHANTLYRKLSTLPRVSGHVSPTCAAVVVFEVDLTALSKVHQLAFASPTTGWADFVLHCRQHRPRNAAGMPHHYDVVSGPLQTLSGRAYPPDHEQVSFHTDVAVSLLKYKTILRGTPQL